MYNFYICTLYKYEIFDEKFVNSNVKKKEKEKQMTFHRY